jgi:hypothetical protein
LGLYYNTKSKAFDRVTATRTDAKIDFDWGTSSPLNGIDSDFFTTRWLGEIEPPLTGTYTFFTESDDGVRLWVNDQLIVDKWILQPATEWGGSINLTAGNKYPIRLEYFEEQGGAVMKLRWSHPNIAKQIIPTSQLYAQVITGITSSHEFQIFPTMVDSELVILSEPTEWIIIDSIGKKIVSGTTIEKQSTINLSYLPSGLYLLKSKLGIVVKFVKK